jgi:hypothetical protein
MPLEKGEPEGRGEKRGGKRGRKKEAERKRLTRGAINRSSATCRPRAARASPPAAPTARFRAPSARCVPRSAKEALSTRLRQPHNKIAIPAPLTRAIGGSNNRHVPRPPKSTNPVGLPLHLPVEPRRPPRPSSANSFPPVQVDHYHTHNSLSARFNNILHDFCSPHNLWSPPPMDPSTIPPSRSSKLRLTSSWAPPRDGATPAMSTRVS